MVFGISQEMLEKAKQIGEHYTMEVVKDCAEGRIEIKLIPRDDWAKGEISTFVNTLTNQLCSQFYTYFGIQGKLIDVE